MKNIEHRGMITILYEKNAEKGKATFSSFKNNEF